MGELGAIVSAYAALPRAPLTDGIPQLVVPGSDIYWHLGHRT